MTSRNSISRGMFSILTDHNYHPV